MYKCITVDVCFLLGDKPFTLHVTAKQLVNDIPTMGLNEHQCNKIVTVLIKHYLNLT